METDDLLLVGRVARAHGNKGQVIVNPASDFPEERFAPGKTLVVELNGTTARRTIESMRIHQGRPILALRGIETMNDAEALAGAELKAPVADIAPLPPRTFYRHDLVGCAVKDVAGHAVGQVTGVEGTLERSHLIVDVQGREAMIPMVEGIWVSVDLEARTIVVNPPAGLLDV